MLQDTSQFDDTSRSRATLKTISFLKKGDAVPPDVFSAQTTLEMPEAKKEMDARVKVAAKDRSAEKVAEATLAAAIYRDLRYVAHGRTMMKLIGYHEAIAHDCAVAGAQR